MAQLTNTWTPRVSKMMAIWGYGIQNDGLLGLWYLKQWLFGAMVSKIEAFWGYGI